MRIQAIIERGHKIQVETRTKEIERVLTELTRKEAFARRVERLMQDPEPLGFRCATRANDLIPGAELYLAMINEAKDGLTMNPASYTPPCVIVQNWSLWPLDEVELKAYSRFGAKNKIIVGVQDGATPRGYPMVDLLNGRMVAWKKL